MQLRKFISFAILILLSFYSQAQKLKKADKVTLANLEAHIRYLADDKLEGRRAGTPGEALAMHYIADQFKGIGLQPKGSDGFFQAFPIYDGKQINPSTQLLINNQSLELNKEFFPLAFSPNISLEALPSIAVQEADMPWFVDLKDPLEENKHNPHFDIEEYIKTNTKKARDRGALAILLYNSSSIDDHIAFEAKDRSDTSVIPVVYLTKETAKKYLSDPAATINLKLTINLSEKKRTGHNVIGYIDNGAPTTVVLGAHFDHLGYGEDGNSMLRTGEKLIHNGADDNASGTAALIELARIITNEKDKKNNFLFISFSAEELGLFGSKYFTENPTIDLRSVNYMINMDMVGRLNDSTNTLTLGGYGTSPTWSEILQLDKKMPFTIKVDSSGTGPSDHTSFYRKDIPVLFFFTGLHPDYHRPTDDYDKINFAGELKIVDYINKIIEHLSKENTRLAFTKTRETQTSTSARFGVTLGIMPDYAFSGSGVRCDGVSDGKPAQKAGLKLGDVIIQLGDHTISSLETYMQALGKFKKGDRTKVKYKRGNDILEGDVQF